MAVDLLSMEKISSLNCQADVFEIKFDIKDLALNHKEMVLVFRQNARVLAYENIDFIRHPIQIHVFVFQSNGFLFLLFLFKKNKQTIYCQVTSPTV